MSYKKSTKSINRSTSKQTKSENILNVVGIGHIKEITVVADQKINMYIRSDNEDFIQNSFDELADMTLYSNYIVAKIHGSNYVISISDIYFKNSISIQANFDTMSTISRISILYELYEVI